MITMYRILKYEFINQEELDHQINKSLATVIHQVGNLGQISVANIPLTSLEGKLLESRIKFPTEIILGCITKEQLERSKNMP
jgi:hypothetical protein